MWPCRLTAVRAAHPLAVRSRTARLPSSTASHSTRYAPFNRSRADEAVRLAPIGVNPERTQHVQQSARAAPASKAYAADTLHAFLSPSNLASPAPQLHSARALRALYLAVRARGDVQKFSAGRLSSLISIFGTLSASAGPHGFSSTDKMRAPVTTHMSAHSFKQQWGFVIQLVKDKAKAEKRIFPADTYWLLRAQLALSELDGVVVDPYEDDELFRAREAYLRLSFDSTNSDPHISYLYTLLHQRRSDAAVELVGWLCVFLRRHTYCSPRFASLLWDTVLSDTVATSEALQDALLQAISHRLNLGNPTHDGTPSGQSMGRGNVDAAIVHDPPFCDNALDLNRQLTSVLFPDPSDTPAEDTSGTPSQLHIRQWALSHILGMFYPDTGLPVSARWRNLTFLALANAPSPDLSQASLSNNTGARKLIAADFRVVAILTILERIAGPTAATDENLRHFVRGLWATWVETVNDDRRVEAALIRPMIASFLRLAAAMRDDALRRACLRLCDTGFWTFHVGDDYAKRQVQMLAAEYVVASARCGETVWEDTVAKLPHYVGLRQWQPVLTDAVIRRLVVLDVHLANEMYALWSRYLDIPPGVVKVLAMGLVREGEMDDAIPLLAQCAFVGREGWDTLGAVLAPLAEHADRFVDSELAAIVNKALGDLSKTTPPPRSIRWDLLWALKALTSAGRASAAASVVKNVASLQPRYFTPGFVSSFLRSLLAHRQYRLAMKLVEDDVVTDPVDAERWRAVLFVRLRRAGASQLATEMGLRAKQRWLPLALARVGNTGRSSPRRRLGFQIHRMLTRHTHLDVSASDLSHGLSVLARLRGLGAAKAVHARLARTHDAQTQTALGNVLLDAYASRRRFRMRDIRHALKTLDFVPDRVSTNTVVKALLRTADPPEIRALFDLFVSRGYPAGPLFSTEVLPFTSSPLPGVLSKLGLPLHGEELCWKRHVRPLYRMFVKALFVRGDVAGARLVVGILKELEESEGERIRRRRQMETR